MNRQSAAIDATPKGSAAELIWAIPTLPTWLKRMKIPMRKPKSPMRLTMNALRPAYAFSSSVNQNPIKR